jgi:hypothetical protein
VPAESRGQVLIDKQGAPAPAAVVAAQGMADAGLNQPTTAGAPGAIAQPGQNPNPTMVEPAAPKAKAPPDEITDPDEDDTDRSRRRLRLITERT